MADTEPGGFQKGHKSGCACPACRGHQAAGERRRAEAEQAAMARASARFTVWMAAQFARQGSGGSGPDVLRQALGPEDALSVLKMAEYGTEQIRASWAAAAPAQRQASVRLGDWGPDHDPRVQEVLHRSGATDAEVYAVLRQVREEHAGKALEAEARRRVYYGLDTPRAALGVSEGPAGPVQRSVVHRDVPELGGTA